MLEKPFSIRLAELADWHDIWHLLEPIFRAGETYPYDPAISKADAYTAWMEVPTATYVAETTTTDAAGPDTTGGRDILGTYYIKPNQPALGAHVCNCGYAVSQRARGKGVATTLCNHSQQEAKRLGFRAMQFNLVVSTNAPAVYLWQKLGFQKVATLPGAFNHTTQGFVDAFVMYKQL